MPKIAEMLTELEAEDDPSPAVRKAMAVYHGLSAVLDTKAVTDLDVARKVSRIAAKAAAEYYEREIAKIAARRKA